MKDTQHSGLSVFHGDKGHHFPVNCLLTAYETLISTYDTCFTQFRVLVMFFYLYLFVTFGDS